MLPNMYKIRWFYFNDLMETFNYQNMKLLKGCTLKMLKQFLNQSQNQGLCRRLDQTKRKK